MYQTNDLAGMEEIEKITGIMSAALTKGKERQGDTLWKTVTRHPLRTIKNKDEFVEHVEKVTKSKTSAFQQQPRDRLWKGNTMHDFQLPRGGGHWQTHESG